MNTTHRSTHTTWLHSDRFVPRRFIQPAHAFMRIEAASGIVMLIAAVAAVIWANAGSGESYTKFFDTEFELVAGSFDLSLHLSHLINDGLMAIFFFVVGIEIKREIVMGELSDRKVAALPIMAALGGMIFPALIYVAFNIGDSASLRGWGVPMATDIAFSAGVLSLLGRRVPLGAKLFLLTLAIADDLGGILVIAVFYTDDLALGWLLAGLGGLVAVATANRVGIRSFAFYVPAAFVIWYFFLESGVHATLAGVALGFLCPARPMYSPREFHAKADAVLDVFPDDEESRDETDHEALLLADLARESVSPLIRAEHRLAKWSSFVVIPVFALANAGVHFEGSITDALTSKAALGVAGGLVIGKTIGITLFTVAGLKAGIGRLPRSVNLRHIVGIAATAGIGFTVALFITALAYTDPVIADDAKVGIFAGSIVAGLLGAAILLTSKSPVDDEPVPEAAS